MTEDEKSRLREEEFFKFRVKRKIEHSLVSKCKKRMDVLNQPIVLWFLSTMVVGIASFSYTEWKDNKEARFRSINEEFQIEREVCFRLRQTSMALGEVIVAYKNCFDNLDNDKLSGTNSLQDVLFNSFKKFAATVELGGVVDVPPPFLEGKGRNIVVEHAEFGLDSLPYRQSYRYPEYSIESLSDLYSRLYLLRNRERAPKSEQIDIDTKLKSLESLSDFQTVDTVKTRAGYIDPTEKRTPVIENNVATFKTKTMPEVRERLKSIEKLLKEIAQTFDSQLVSQFDDRSIEL